METLFLRNGYLLWIAVIVLLVAGLSAVEGLPRLEDPRMTNRNPLVLARYPGASAERVESLITEKLEESLQEIPEIKKLESTSRAGAATILIELAEEIDEESNDEVFSRIRDKIADVPMPAGAPEPELDDQRGAVAFTLVTALVWDFDSPPQLGLLRRRGEDLADRLRTVSGTEIVRTYGAPIEEITVRINPAKLASLQIAVRDVSRAIAEADAKTPAGQLHSEQRDLSLEVAGSLDSVSRIESIPLRTTEFGSSVRVVDVAGVTRRWKTPQNAIALANGRRAVYVAARMKPDIRVDQWSRRARKVVDGYRGEVGSGIAVETVFDQNLYTSERLGTLTGNLLAGAGVIMAVVFFFMGWRSSLIVGAALPLVSGATLFLLMVAGGSLHQMSIFGMILALGLLIDNAIVVVDEIKKTRRRGADRVTAVRRTLRHLFGPLVASTLTTIFAFLPIVLLPGNIGDFVASIGGSVIAAVGSSLVIALTLIAALAGRCDHADVGPPSGRWWKSGWTSPLLARLYERTLRRGLRFPLAAMMLAAAGGGDCRRRDRGEPDRVGLHPGGVCARVAGLAAVTFARARRRRARGRR